MKTAHKQRRKGPSRASLRDIPEINFSKVRVQKNAYSESIKREGIVVQVGRGRPKKYLEVGETSPRSVRFPDAIWKQIEKRAKLKGITLHAALREAIMSWLKGAA